jgi:thiol:disulfide interchange protein DsbD
MKKTILALTFIFCGSFLFAQMVSNPVEWSATAKKIGDKIYEIRLSADIKDGWHIYSQTTPDGGPIPTAITFTKNPLVISSGIPKETGKLEKRFEPLFGVDVKQYSDKVEFVQIVKLKANVKTSVALAVEFMVCNDKQCLPPTTKKFTVALK